VNTIWGKSDNKITLARGLSWVGTPSHGGFAITVKAAQQYLTNAAIARGERRGAYLFYEEDCLASIILYELPQALRLKWSTSVPTREALVESLSNWNADYLLEVGVTPTEAGLKFFNENKKQDQMRAERSGDLIVSATGTIAKWVPEGWVGVITADGNYHLVLSSEYDNRANLNLLSNYPSAKAAL
jgi:uncharacterized protein DUF7007